ncbi:hypothetical protein J3E64_001943 [Sphingobium sp. OAS761]|uniref:hypothetical protein n=1 Tax=Sphingobium sp. OAS761 TaxID=2817901 RepID=UPI0020A10266|nr:hypothetical protein [Sphingobium sp. OAS761]MCP1470255.1 hypothetical protein [Sphingobium sp. OAS761]
MQLLARFLDWLCLALADGVQDEMHINRLICPLAGGVKRPNRLEEPLHDLNRQKKSRPGGQP